MENQPKDKLSSGTVGLMIGTALFFDALQWAMAFLLMDPLVTVVAYMTFWLWFYLRGVKLLTPKRASIQGGTILIELIPLVAALPAITAMVTLTILSVKAEKTLKNMS